jgi:hypothetical protein
LEKAKLILKGENSTTEISVLFNPEQYKISRTVNYATISVPGLDNPITQFISGKQTSLSLTLFFDTQNDYVPKGTKADVREVIKPILKSVQIDGQLHAPPIAIFRWGSLSFAGVITNIEQTFTLFQASGIPVRCKLDVTFQYVTGNDDKKKSPFESPDRTKVRTLEQSGALWRLAHAEYGDSALWRSIAEANAIDNPLNSKSGQSIIVPPLS